ncbi:hypothetical protein BKA62DRAFT_773331 [Auriculariales sp. MPI-PUGE-AT-0066]|nr:hypothetical protein BKA62DRAFT_773331 [Auriculariales sp. MPI-PUGE-AT-0066]
MWPSTTALFFISLTLCRAITPGIYRVTPRDFQQVMLTQSGASVVTAGGSRVGDAAQTWYISPAASGAASQISIQNAKTLQYVAVAGKPENNTDISISTEPFAWNLTSIDGAGTAISLNEFYLTDIIGFVPQKIVTGPPVQNKQQWILSSILPMPTTYKLWNIATDTYLTAPESLPGQLLSLPLNASASQTWSLTGTGPGVTSGTLQNINTGGTAGVVNGVAGVYLPNNQTGSYLWYFNGASSERLTSNAPSPNVLALDQSAQVIVDTPDSGNEQGWVFVPVAP